MKSVALPVRWIAGLANLAGGKPGVLGLALLAIALGLASPAPARAYPYSRYGPYYRYSGYGPYTGYSAGYGPYYGYSGYRPYYGFSNYDALRLYSQIQQMRAETAMHIAENSMALSRYAADTMHKALQSFK
jgi:hypothetical protein